MAPIATAPDNAVCMNPPPAAESATVPVVQVKNFISTGRAKRAMHTMAKPIRTVRTSLPVPIIVNAVA
jgi:hypothetical protein